MILFSCSVVSVIGAMDVLVSYNELGDLSILCFLSEIYTISFIIGDRIYQ